MTAQIFTITRKPEARRRMAARIIEEVAAKLRCVDPAETVLKQSIIEAYSAGQLSQEDAINMIRERGLKHA